MLPALSHSPEFRRFLQVVPPQLAPRSARARGGFCFHVWECKLPLVRARLWECYALLEFVSSDFLVPSSQFFVLGVIALQAIVQLLRLVCLAAFLGCLAMSGEQVCCLTP